MPDSETFLLGYEILETGLFQPDLKRHHTAARSCSEKLGVIPVKDVGRILSFLFHQGQKRYTEIGRALCSINKQRTLVAEDQQAVRTSRRAGRVAENVYKKTIVGRDAVGFQYQSDGLVFRKISHFLPAEIHVVEIGGIGPRRERACEKEKENETETHVAVIAG